MAEAVRGGLQAAAARARPRRRRRSVWATGASRALIVLPQALRIALPAMTNEFIALFKNTTLVLIVSLFDLLGHRAGRAGRSRPGSA